MLAAVNNFLKYVDDLVWGVPLIVAILLTGIYLTIRLKGIQITKLPKALKYMFENEESGHGEVTSFGALCTALSATIGTGNIVGVATAIVAGGPGALFWMEIAALFGMATKYSEGLLAIKYRTTDKHGHILGGPFYYIENGMGKKWTWLAKIFAFFGMGVGLFGIGTFTQVNGITSAVGNFFDPNAQHVVHLLGRDYTLAVVISGLILTVCVGLVVIGGLKRIAKVSEIVVPFMAVIYITISLLLLILNAGKIPAAVAEIVSSAFGLRAAAGGALGAIIVAMQKGIARGIFSNEAGLGSAPIAAAAAQTKEPARQGLVTMTGTFIDTICVCTMTGLAIIITQSYLLGVEGSAMTTLAFQNGFPIGEIGIYVVNIGLLFFAFTTIIGWNYYGEKCIQYLLGEKAILPYKILFIVLIGIGPFMSLDFVFTLADIVNGCMAFPNLIGLIALRKVVVNETRAYFKTALSKEKTEDDIKVKHSLVNNSQIS